jgi:hypothetical protein
MHYTRFAALLLLSFCYISMLFSGNRCTFARRSVKCPQCACQRCHCACFVLHCIVGAIAQAPFDEGLVVCMDGMGELLSAMGKALADKETDYYHDLLLQQQQQQPQVVLTVFVINLQHLYYATNHFDLQHVCNWCSV